MKSENINHKAIKNLFTRKEKRKVSVLDLFFDITLIVFIGGISHQLIENLQGTIDWSKVFTGILELFTIFFIWRIYMIFAMYSKQSVSYRVLTMVVMSSLVAMGLASYFAAATKDAFLLNIIGFDIAMFAITIAYIFLSIPLLKNVNKSEGRDKVAKRAISLIASFTLSIIIATIALIFNYLDYSESTHKIVVLALWALNLFQLFIIEFLSSKWTWKYEVSIVKLIEERYNVLFVLFCGEGIITVVTAFAGVHQGVHLFDSTFWYLIMAFIAIFGTWWLFNDYITYTKLKPSNKQANAFTYVMLPFLASITTFFIGVALMIEGDNFVGSVVVALAFGTIAILFPILLLLQEPFRDDHMYIRRRVFEVFIILFGAIFGSVVITIDVLLPIPFLVLGIALGGITLWVCFAFWEYVQSLRACKGDRTIYEEFKARRIEDQLFK